MDYPWPVYGTELTHHGVKGQKWGIRRYQPYPEGTHGMFLGQTRDSDIRLKKGTTAYRIQNGEQLTGSGQTYVSFTKLDSLKYAGYASSMSGGLNCKMQDGNGNIVMLKVTNDLVAPSYKKTMDSFIDTIRDIGVKEFSNEVASATKAGYSPKQIKKQGKEYVKKCKNLDVDECLDDLYIDFTKSFIKDSKAKSIFFDKLKSQGYNAIVDENDKKFAKKDQWGEDESSIASPMIVFDKQKDLKTSGSIAVDKKDADFFREIYYQGESYSPGFDQQKKKWDTWSGGKEYRMNNS